MIELWKPVVLAGIPYPYEVSHLARVRNNKGKILSPSWRGQRKGTYLAVWLYRKGRRKKAIDIHRLCALHWGYNPNPGRLTEVDHNDQDHLNNGVWNIGWVDRSTNERRKSNPSIILSIMSPLSMKETLKQEHEKYKDTIPF